MNFNNIYRDEPVDALGVPGYRSKILNARHSETLENTGCPWIFSDPLCAGLGPNETLCLIS